MRLLLYESSKIVYKKMVFLFLFMLVALNLFLFYQKQTSYDAAKEALSWRQEYLTMERQYASMPFESAAMEIKAFQEKMQLYLQFSNLGASDDFSEEQYQQLIEQYPEAMAQFRESPYSKDSALLHRHSQMALLFMNQVTYIEDYPGYISSMKERAEKMLSVSIFYQEGSFSYRNALKTPEDFQGLEQLPLSIGDEKGVVSCTNFSVTDYLMLAAIFMLCILLFQQEKESGMLLLLKPCKYGRVRLILSKLTVLCASTIVIGLIMYGSLILLGSKLYGFGELQRYVQSMPSFRECVFPITVIEYFILYLVSKLLTCLLAAGIFALFFTLFSSIGLTYTVTGGYLLVSYLLFSLIGPLSPMNTLKYINLFSFFHVFQLYAQYTNLNLFGYPVERASVFYACSIFAFLLCIAAIMIVFVMQKRLQYSPIFASFLSKIKQRIPATPFGYLLFFQELWKTLISEKALLVLVIACLLCYGNILKEAPITSQEEYYYTQYMQQLAGPLDAEKEAFLQKEQQHFDDLDFQLEQAKQELLNNAGSLKKVEYLSMLIKNEKAKRDAFTHILSQRQRLTALQQNGQEGWFVNEYATDYLFQNTSRDLVNGALFSILLILAASGIFSKEYAQKSVSIIHSSRFGHLKLYLYKYLIAFLLSIFIFIPVYYPQIYNTIQFYALGDWNPPLISIASMGNSVPDMTILQFQILAFGLMLLSNLLCICTILLLSVLLKKKSFTIIYASLLIVFPPLLQNISNLSISTVTINAGMLSASGWYWENPLGGLLYYGSMFVLCCLAIFAGYITFLGYFPFERRGGKKHGTFHSTRK